jgi:putative two-component system response regulator
MIIDEMQNPTLPLSSKKILVIENNQADRLQVTRCLEIEGYEVLQAANGEDAMRGISRFIPDLIITSLEMPGMSASDFYHAVRKDPRLVPVPFIFLTNDSTYHENRSQTVLFMEDYLRKPIEPDGLLRRVHARLLRASEIQVAHLDQAYLETVTMLANAIEGRDPYTRGHVDRVYRYARWLAEALDWPDEHLRRLEFGARLHDIGKITVDDHILKKPGPLTPQEWDIMRKHPTEGGKMMEEMRHLQDTLPYVLYHHERWDGTGYPEGRQGRDIPIEGRVMAIVDVFDALTSSRPYHPPRPAEEVKLYLKIKAGVQFDPELVGVFLRILEERIRLKKTSLLT